MLTICKVIQYGASRLDGVMGQSFMQYYFAGEHQVFFAIFLAGEHHSNSHDHYENFSTGWGRIWRRCLPHMRYDIVPEFRCCLRAVSIDTAVATQVDSVVIVEIRESKVGAREKIS